MATKRKSDQNESPPKKKVKISTSAKKNDGSKKPALTYEWTRTDPVTGAKGKLFRKDIDYFIKQNSRRAKHIALKNAEEDDDIKESKQKKKKSPKKNIIKPLSSSDEFADLTNRFDNHVCIVTGGGRGIGQSIALRLAQEGAIVYILDKIRWLDTIKILEDAYGTKNSKKCKGYKCDCTDIKQVKNIINKIFKEHGYIDVLINAISELDTGKKKSHEFELNDIEKSLNKNFYTMFNVTKIVIPIMLKEGYGRIVNIASIDGKEGREGHLAYSMTTGGIIAATKTMGKEYAGTGLTINCVAPVVDYQVTKLGKKELKKEVGNVPMGRAAEQSELSGLVAFIASEENTYTTGFCYDLSGGVCP